MAKQLFKTSEKSNFILNLTEEKYSQLASKALAGLFVLMPLFAIPSQCTDKVGFSVETIGLIFGGVVCMIFALIAMMKKYITKKMLIPVIAFAGMLGFGAVSLFDCYNRQVGFYGTDGRGEGLLAIIFYFCFFITGLSLKTEKSVITLIYGVIASGAVNALWALVQLFYGKIGDFTYVSVKIKAHAVSGLAQNPIFFSMLLTLSLTAALIGFIMTGSKRTRIILAVCAALFSFTMPFTHTIMGFAGIAVAAVSTIIAAFISKSPKIRLAGLLTAVIPPIISIIIVSAGLIGNISEYKLYDGRIMWWDSYNRLSASGIFDPRVTEIDIEDPLSFYPYMTEETLDIIKTYPLTGAGPDQLVYPQIHVSEIIQENPNTFDKNYNEYLYTAATRGIPSLLLLITVIASLIANSAAIVNHNRKSLAAVCTFMLLAAGALIFFIGNSNTIFSPIYWALSGASCASLAEASKKVLSKKHQKAYGKSK
ncbi:MAG: O-antigen ligase family protein [Ruminococcus sp.]